MVVHMKADEPRQNRIPFMMSDAELTAVDDWRFTNRIATRAEAIRRLVQIGLRAERDVIDLMAQVLATYEDLGKMRGIAHGGVQIAEVANVPVDKHLDYMRMMAEEADNIAERYIARSDTFFSLTSQIRGLTKAGTIDEALTHANEARALLEAGETVSKALKAKLEAQTEEPKDIDK